MFIIFIYNDSSRRLERYSLEAYDNMPYILNNSMLVSDFFKNSSSYIGWSSSSFLQAWDSFSFGEIRPCHVFRRLCEGGHIQNSMHFAGLAADFEISDSDTEKAKISDINNFFRFSENYSSKIHVSSQNLQKQFPRLSYGMSGLFVLILQDALNTLGFTGGELDGFFGSRTKHSLGEFQKSQNLPVSYEADADTWLHLTLLAAGHGISGTTTHMRGKHRFFCCSEQ